MQKRAKEIWVDVVGYEDYQISNWGNVFSTKTNSLLTLSLNEKGYLMVQFTKGKGSNFKFRVNRLVALHFVPNPDNKPEVGHSNGNKTDNYYENLKWETRLENMTHAKEHDLVKSGLNHPSSKLSKEQVLEIRNSSGSVRKLANKYGVGATVIQRVKSGIGYKNVA